MISNAWTIGIPADIMVASLTAEYRDTLSLVTLPPLLNMALWVLTPRAATPCRAQIGAQRRFIRGQRLTPVPLWPRLSLPSQWNWVSFFTCGCGYGHKSVLR